MNANRRKCLYEFNWFPHSCVGINTPISFGFGMRSHGDRGNEIKNQFANKRECSYVY